MKRGSGVGRCPWLRVRGDRQGAGEPDPRGFLLAPAAIEAILGYHSAGRPSAASINSLRNHRLSE
jgi:hypothetical protein